ncbi:MAG: biotin--[acetyl-CoA-carboxylase] ligase [Acidipila sp.]|nr:biotin--[acetyl-CoA-carboxylase] ligase [Acidipila sp.]
MRTVPGTTDRKVLSLLALFSANPLLVLSGARVARHIGVSRSTVWRWVGKLRELGVDVKGHPRTGYHIEGAADVLVPTVLKRRLAGTPFSQRIHHFFSVGSTNDVAMQLGQAGEPHGALVVAEYQTAGRGRAGRTWLSEKSSGIHMTVLLRPAVSPVQAPMLTLVAGLAARDAVSEASGLNCDIRWPNDLMLNGKKVGGVLTEMHAEPDRIRFVVIGIGINVNHTKMPKEIDSIATSLRMETGHLHSRAELVVRVLRHLDGYYKLFLSEGGEPLVARFAEVSSYFQGKRVRITTATECYVGLTAGLEPSGMLRVLRDDGRTEPVVAGDVHEAL